MLPDYFEDDKFLERYVKSLNATYAVLLWPATFIFFIVAAGAIVLLFQFLTSVPDAVIQSLSTARTAVQIGTLVLILGILFCWLKIRYTGIYGAMELGCAFGTAYLACRHLNTGGHDVIPLLFSLFGCIYIAVRGVTNLSEALRR
ncbi:hypothetical protein SAMN05446927_6586 [Caballeronia arationis]|uniref:Uncharacterized protein n=1 Tax=Caballeronia arationis TaxID=1777142 RepID=A0A7Z7IDM5_9BURK|nr:hypothetical protein [Caballeronia arationis]SOE87996.1 hypothetical protein SAMN05446927_6586 [Caballeronia arationis]